MAITPVQAMVPEVGNAVEPSPQTPDGKTLDPKMVKAAHDFEAYVMGYVFQSAAEAVPQSEFSGGGMANNVFQSMFIQEVTAKSATGEKGCGLADMMLRQWSRGPHGIPNQMGAINKELDNSHVYESVNERI